MAKRDPRLKRLGLKGFNKPKRTPGHPTKSHVVLAKEDPKPKLFGLANKEYPGPEKILKLQKIRPEENHLRPGTEKILQKAK